MSATIHTLTVLNSIVETEDTRSIQLTVPEALRETFAYKAGQYITVEVHINGETLRRAYSLSSAPYESQLQFSVKRVEGGKVSNYIVDNLQSGSTLSVLAPEGKFVVLPEQDKSKDHYFIAAGSGITPVMSMIKTLLEQEERSSIYLLYSNKTEESVIFKQQLDNLAAKYEGQLTVLYTLTQIQQKKGLFNFLGKKSDPTWSGLKGRVDAKMLDYLFKEYPPRNSEAHYYICGPGEMIESVDGYLKGNGMPAKYIHKEYFTAPVTGTTAGGASLAAGIVTVTLDKDTFTVNVPEGKTILETLLADGKTPPYSCTSGACASCMAKIVTGKVEMDSCFSLDDDEVANGYILTCQSHPVGAGVAITYDDL